MITSRKTVFLKKKKTKTKNQYFVILQRQARLCVTLYENHQEIIEVGYGLIVYGLLRTNKLFSTSFFFKKTFILTDFSSRYLDGQIIFLIYFPRCLKIKKVYSYILLRFIY